MTPGKTPQNLQTKLKLAAQVLDMWGYRTSAAIRSGRKPHRERMRKQLTPLRDSGHD